MKKSRVFGGSSTVLSPSYDPKWLCWRTCQTSFDWAEPMSLDRLPKSGMIANGQLYRLDNLEHPICANDGLVLPTPTCHDAKNNMSPSCWTRQADLGVEIAKMQGYNQESITGKGLRIHPHFVEWMMGFPIGWTDLNPLETQSSHSAQNGLDNK